VGGWAGTREAAEALGVTLRTLYRFIDEGRLPAYKMGRVIRLRGDDIDRFRDQGGHWQPGPDAGDNPGGARVPLPPGPAGAMALEES
jgi:excisionase family DNA binding protein